MRSAEIREIFLKFFEQKGHTRVASSSLVPQNDPTLYFTNAGMVPFKEIFLGKEKRAYTKACSSQKCMRVSGKHNDLENVGLTPRHHTFFEMLGNFSFGGYFKKEAIAFAWEFLAEVVKLPKEKLIITVFEKDMEAEKLWQKYASKEKIFKRGEKDNFWSMGETGPCGPCSEILWDFGSGKFSKRDLDSDRFFEVWNLVFMEFNRETNGRMGKLPKPSIDTGMGLERLACLLQKKESNWETDLFAPIIQRIEMVSARKANASEENKVAMRVIADHVRCATFLISDGVLPSNEGRGYVLRRILRRAIRYARKLDVREPILAKVSEAVVQEMSPAYPEIQQNQSLVQKALQTEEENFSQTIDRGMEILEAEFKQLKKKTIPGKMVFKLYDTYGFPKDLTELIARERGYLVDEAGFDEEMERQRQRGRMAWKGSGGKEITPVLQEIYKKGNRTRFFYDRLICEKESPLYFMKEGKLVDHVATGETFDLVVSQTPFYAEGGGQVGDTGWVYPNRGEADVLDTQKPYPDLFVHHAHLKKGELSSKDFLKLVVDQERRQKIMCNHTATHLLHAALRQILGKHVKQAGSYLDDAYLRFDFSHFSAITEKQLAAIEALVNKVIQENLKVTTEVLPYQAALQKGALAFFGEKYGEEVRMVQVDGFSMELCGGTHVAQTKEIGYFRIAKERSVASGVRRIEAFSGIAAEEYEKEKGRMVKERETQEKEKGLRKESEKQGGAERIQAALQAIGDPRQAAKKIQGVKVLSCVVRLSSVKELREVVDRLKQDLGSGIVAVGAEIEGKVALVVAVTKDLVQKYHAGELVKELAAKVGGTGGGRPDLAQGGGPDVANLKKALKNFLEAKS